MRISRPAYVVVDPYMTCFQDMLGILERPPPKCNVAAATAAIGCLVYGYIPGSAYQVPGGTAVLL